MLDELNGVDLTLGNGNSLAELQGTPVKAGEVPFAPMSIPFFSIPKAHNASCEQ